VRRRAGVRTGAADTAVGAAAGAEADAAAAGPGGGAERASGASPTATAPPSFEGRTADVDACTVH
ncbi:hypothetical protein ACWC5I_26870, partial [Kitasatospora sp. NPDC001574]